MLSLSPAQPSLAQRSAAQPILIYPPAALRTYLTNPLLPTASVS